MRKIETEKTMRKEERYKGVLNWFKENVPVASNRAGVIIFTRLSVHCADRITAINN